MAFEVFTEAGARTKEFVSITENKTFGLSRAFLDKHGIGKNHKAVILYDAEEKKIALHFTTQETKVGFSVRISNPKHGASIVARSFFDKRLDAQRYSGRYDDYTVRKLRDLGVDKDGYAYIIELKESKTDAKQPVQQVEQADNASTPRLDDIPF